MATTYIGDIRTFSFEFAPRGWAACNGQLLPINQNQPLFSLLGTTYGGDGRVNFGLPNLQGRIPMHAGSGYTLGQRGGEESHTLTLAELATHSHPVVATTNATNAGNVPAGGIPTTGDQVYVPGASNTNPAALQSSTLTSLGGSQAHTNMQPYLVLFFCIALQGIFPSRS